MPRQKDFKRLVRARMRKTGEAYTTARARILDRRRKPVKKAAPDYATLAGMSDDTLKAKTGCTWERWVTALDHHGAEALPHREIAKLVNEKYKIDGWWSQMVTVGYERIKGLRDRGQRRGGGYEVNKSKTLHVSAARLAAAFANERALRRWLPEAAKLRKHTKGRSARVGLEDGAIAAFWFDSKGVDKYQVGVQQGKLPSREAAEAAKKYWGERLAALAEVVS